METDKGTNGEEASQLQKLTAKEERFCMEYLVDLNASRAARSAGYSEKTARQIGYENLTKPYIRSFIDARLKEKTMRADEVLKMTSDIAKSSLNEFFTISKKEYTPRVIKTLGQLIKELETEITLNAEYAEEAELNDDETEAHQAEQKWRRRQVLKYKIELRHNPSASRIVNGEPEMIEAAELDLVKLVKAKESGRIKSLSYTPSGIPKIDMYSADAALVSLARMHGLYIDKTEVTGKDGEPLPKQVIVIGGKEIEF